MTNVCPTHKHLQNQLLNKVEFSLYYKNSKIPLRNQEIHKLIELASLYDQKCGVHCVKTDT